MFKKSKNDNFIVKMAKKVAERDANTSCPFLGYQPKLPKEIKRLRKF